MKPIIVQSKFHDARPPAMMTASFEERGDEALIIMSSPYLKDGKWVQREAVVKLADIQPAESFPGSFPYLKEAIHYSKVVEAPL